MLYQNYTVTNNSMTILGKKDLIILNWLNSLIN